MLRLIDRNKISLVNESKRKSFTIQYPITKIYGGLRGRVRLTLKTSKVDGRTLCNHSIALITSKQVHLSVEK